MALIKDRQFIADPWREAASAEHAPAGVPMLVTLEQWRHHREALLARGTPLGIRLASDQPPHLVAEDLAHFALIALEFPKFTDGRSYSHARILRGRHDFRGEVRATGNILRDQLAPLQRCGFDAFQVPERARGEGWLEAFSEISVVLQPAADTAPSPAQTPPRQPAKSCTEPFPISALA